MIPFIYRKRISCVMLALFVLDVACRKPARRRYCM